MELHLSLVGRRNLSREIYRQIRQAILDARLRPNDVLPPSRELARNLSVSRTTVTVAYDRLASEGFVTTRVGAGTFVCERAAPQTLASRARPRAVLRARPIWDGIPIPTGYLHPARFDLRTGDPDSVLFPHDAWRRMVSRQMRAGSPATGAYGHPAGHGPLREAIARRVGVARGVDASPDDVIITSGTQQAIDVIARVLLEPGDQVAVEDPGYPPPRHLFASLGARVVAVPVDREGLVVEGLPRRARLVYVTPSHQYPLGVPLALPRRHALLAWADRENAAIIEDDYDSEFRFDGRPLESLRALDGSGRVIYVGSFSKTMLPSLRLGFIVAPPSLREALHRAKFVSDWHTTTSSQVALARFIAEGGFARHLRRMGSVYRVRRALVLETLRRDFAEHLEVAPSAAGLHVGALARKGSVAAMAQVVERAGAAGVEVRDLARFAFGPAKPAGLVIGYGAIQTHDIEEALRRLRRCFAGVPAPAGA